MLNSKALTWHGVTKLYEDNLHNVQYSISILFYRTARSKHRPSGRCFFTLS